MQVWLGVPVRDLPVSRGSSRYTPQLLPILLHAVSDGRGSHVHMDQDPRLPATVSPHPHIRHQVL